jgi:hypothetical protein
MGFFQNLGSKVKKIAALGAKHLGTVANIGGKVVQGLNTGLALVNQSPLGAIINSNPKLRMLNAGATLALGGASSLLKGASNGAGVLNEASQGNYEKALQTGITNGMAGYARTRDVIERSRKIPSGPEL